MVTQKIHTHTQQTAAAAATHTHTHIDASTRHIGIVCVCGGSHGSHIHILFRSEQTNEELSKHLISNSNLWRKDPVQNRTYAMSENAMPCSVQRTRELSLHRPVANHRQEKQTKTDSWDCERGGRGWGQRERKHTNNRSNEAPNRKRETNTETRTHTRKHRSIVHVFNVLSFTFG